MLMSLHNIFNESKASFLTSLLYLVFLIYGWFFLFVYFACLGDSPAIQEKRVTTVQCLSGTGSLRVGAEFLARHHHQVKCFCLFLFLAIIYHMKTLWPCGLLQRTIYIPQPTWGNHGKIFTLAGLSVKTYRYYDPATRGLNFQGLKLSSINYQVPF